MITAAGKAFGGNALKGVKEAAAGDNKEAGKLFAGNGNGNADAAAIGKAASAVTAVSGEQILKAIVEAAGAGNQAGATAGAATNPIEAAIGTDGDQAAFGDNGMKKSDKIAAAIVLRGVAKDGKFAAANNANVKSAVGEVSKWLGEMITAAGDAAKGGTGGANEKIGDVGAANKGAKAEANSVKEIAKGIKGIVDAAGKAFGGNALTGVKEAAAGDENGANADAGKLFATQAAAGAGADVAKAASAVTAVSGEQILKAIVDAAGDTANQAGAGANAATNPIAAAIGADGAGAAFNQDEMKKSDKIAAAIVLRGVAKDGKFAAADNDNSKASVKSAVGEVSKWLGEMITAAGEAAKGGTGGANEKIGDAANNGAKADADSVKEIAKGIKGIVDAAGK
uniref:variable large family protein n=1 Tax=Borreliella afzelii TaxID=29518 RepID=UPI003BF542BD